VNRTNIVINLFSTISFILISTFTPGPSNISSASVAILHGYKNTLKYQAGLATGVFMLMFLSGLFSAALLKIFPALEPILRYVGAAYILYLAFGILKASYNFTEKDVRSFEFTHGVMLNILNPKLYVYTFTLFSTFLVSINQNLPALTIMAIALAAVSFCATSVWALFGTGIKTYLHNPRLQMMLNIALSLLLIYAAISLLEII
jgi:cysteine/O-acetylserine efflux protein